MEQDAGNMVVEQTTSYTTVALMTTTAALGLLTLLAKAYPSKPKGKLPPVIPHTIPFLGHAINFGDSPIEFLVAAYQKYGPVFTFQMVGKTFTYLIGSDASRLFFDSRNEVLNAEDVYSKLTTPVFGKGVAYDVPNPMFLEQKKVMKTGLNIARFRLYIPLIQQETEDYFKRVWGESGEKDLFKALSELIILTASSCLHGSEIRSILDTSVAKLYWDLDGGFTPEAWLLPSWLPLPSFRRRDEAHRAIKKVFYEAIQKRRESGESQEDMLQTFLDSTYKSGRPFNDDEIAGMLIGLLMAGQHTSSTTGSWMGFFIAQHKNVQEDLKEELERVFGSSESLDYDGLKDCGLLERCVKETLRLRPPIMTMMRMARKDVSVLGFDIPTGHQVCVSPTTNHRLPDTWEDYGTWQPDRFLDNTGVLSEEKFCYIPFGAGRHRCIGESFAYVQIKTIWATLLRRYDFELVNGKFPDIDYTTMIHTPKDPMVRYKLRAQ